ncbi:MAG TPA: sialidase family protein [Thermoanaerobaculia bacterium]|nr:sialidase family protein [Thermoanaerobaculia bacterium]
MALAQGAQTREWPTLAQQLERDRVAPGSALERFIAANQDFQMLRAEEIADPRGVPAWLKVAWRKAHPRDRYSADDPLGGYPFFLKEIHEWMVSHPDLKRQPREADVPPAKAATAAGDRRISGPQLRPRSESDIRINFWNPNQIVAGSNNLDGFSGRLGIYYSQDGGATWGQTTLPLVSTDDYHGDPAVDWTSDGTAWALTLGIRGTSLNELRVRAYRSTDGGATWTFDGTPSGSQRGADKERLWVDHSAASPYRDTLHATWRASNGPTWVARRTAAGWQKAVRVSPTGYYSFGGDVTTNTVGEVIVSWTVPGLRNIQVARSTDGGASFGNPITVATTFDTFDIGIPAMATRRPVIVVSSGTYRTAGRNEAYLAWMDLSGEPGCTDGSQEPGSNVASPCTTRVWFSRSTDGGLTWSAPVRIWQQAALNDQFNPWLAVDETTGKVGIAYYDTVADPGRVKTHLYYQSSADGGLTWTEPLQVTSAETDESVAGTDFANQYGDYNGMSAYQGRFFPAWTDRRDGQREEIWTAPILDP